MTGRATHISESIQRSQPYTVLFYVAALLAAAGLFLLSRSNYLLFHNLIELPSIAISVTLFSIGWNTRNITRNEPLTLLAVFFLVIGLIDLLHTLSYKGMGIFPGASVDPPTQFWIAARFMEGISYLLAAFLLNRSFRFNSSVAITASIGLGALLILSIWPLKIFPSCLVEGQGLTPFKVTAEYALSLILALSAALFWKNREYMPRPILRLLLGSIGFAIASKMSFTLYSDVYGLTNVLGHILRFVSLVLVYRAIAIGALKDPFQTLFHDLKISNQALDAELVQRRQTEEELRGANRELDSFVHTVSHDLRSPLTVIAGSAELLEMELEGKIENKYLEFLKNINNQSHHMAAVLNNLLSLASIGRVEKDAEPVELEQVANRVVTDLHQEITESGCQVEIDALPHMQAHPSLIYQLLLNLIGNAVRYGANPDKPVTVSGKASGGTIYLSVADHGHGIPEQERKAIFDVFYRGKDEPEKPGTGIGLASACKIARYYNGSISAEETPGGGATFQVKLKESQTTTASEQPEELS